MPGRRTVPLALAVVLALLAALTLVLRPDAVRAAPEDRAPAGASDEPAPAGAPEDPAPAGAPEEPAPAGAPEDPAPAGAAGGSTGVEVGGVGTASGTPDVLRVTVGVEVAGDSVDAALSGADDAARRVLAALADAGVPERDVQTAHVSVHPRYDGQGERITGYTARHDLALTLRDVDAAGSVIASVADAGGDAARIEGISYALEDDAAVEQEARVAAFADAQRKAEQYARLVGRELGEVLGVRENVSAPGPLPYGAADESAAGGSLALAPGSTQVTVTAEVRWSLR